MCQLPSTPHLCVLHFPFEMSLKPSSLAAASPLPHASLRSHTPRRNTLGRPRARATSLRSRGLSIETAALSSTATIRERRRAGRNPAPNYESRVLAGEFEPTALRARTIAASRGTTLHELAHDLGYALPPPAVRRCVDLTALTRSALAAATGYAISDISRTFARRHPPTLTKLARIAAAYEAWMDDVLTAMGW
jgi:hypothetical protein